MCWQSTKAVHELLTVVSEQCPGLPLSFLDLLGRVL